LTVTVLGAACTFSAHAEDKGNARPRFVLEWGKQGSANGEFDFPIGIAISTTDEVFVTDFKNARVQKFRANGEFVSSFPVAPFPGGIALDADGNIYTAHFGIPPSRYDKPRQRDMIAVHSPSGELLRQWGRFGDGDGEFNLPGGIAISSDGRVYVADSCNRRIQVFDRQGKFLAKWGSKGARTGEFGGNAHPKAFFAGPIFVALDRKGDLFTTEAGTMCRVQKFTSTGKFLLTWGDNKDVPGKFGGYFTGFGNKVMQGPTGICADAQGRLWVNSLSGRIQQFTADGQYLGSFGAEGAKTGQFYAPHGIAIDSRGCLYIVDAFNHRIQKFDPSER
jgi:sugar lactone lactonase YvrE